MRNKSIFGHITNHSRLVSIAGHASIKLNYKRCEADLTKFKTNIAKELIFWQIIRLPVEFLFRSTIFSSFFPRYLVSCIFQVSDNVRHFGVV